MKIFLKDLAIAILIEVLLSGLTYAAKSFNLITESIYPIILYGFIPIVVLVIWFAYRIYRQQEILRINNVLMNNFFLENWVHIIALLESDEELWKKMNAKEELKEHLKKAWSEKYNRKFRTELYKLYPKKTEPQINKILDKFLKS